jgi:hypothetical protein
MAIILKKKGCCIPSYHQAAGNFLPSPLAFRRINEASHTRWPLASLPVGNAEKKRKKGKKRKNPNPQKVTQ